MLMSNHLFVNSEKKVLSFIHHYINKIANIGTEYAIAMADLLV